MSQPVSDFEAFCEAEWPRLTRTLALACGDAGVAQELAQEAFVRTAVRWSRVRRLDAPAAWTRHVAINLLRSRQRRLVTERRARSRLGDRPEAGEADPASRLDLVAALAELEPLDREVLVLRFYADLPYRDIAGALGVSEGAARVRANRALARLRTGMQTHGTAVHSREGDEDG